MNLLEIVEQGHHEQSTTVKALVSKSFFSLHLKMRLELGYTYAKGSQLSGGAVTGYVSNIGFASPEVSFSPAFGSLTYSGRFILNYMKAGETSHNRLFCHTQRFSYTHSIGNIDLSLSAVWYHNELQSAASVNTLIADAGAVWRMKKIRSQALLRNLFDRRSHTVTSYNGVVSSTDLWQLRSCELVVSLQFSL